MRVRIQLFFLSGLSPPAYLSQSIVTYWEKGKKNSEISGEVKGQPRFSNRRNPTPQREVMFR